MKPEEFCYWLHGYFELANADREPLDFITLTPMQTEMIQKHLNSVFTEKIMITTQPAPPIVVDPNWTTTAVDTSKYDPGTTFICQEHGMAMFDWHEIVWYNPIINEVKVMNMWAGIFKLSDDWKYVGAL